ncbi:MAG: SET domain-containing protein [Candidatus Peregrinibacteria bacterium]
MKTIYHSWIHPSLEVRTVPFGKGLFTTKRIKKDEILVIFGGYIFSFAEELLFPRGMRDFAHQISPKFVMGVRKRSELQPVDYINHSCSPNAGFKGQIFLVAMKDLIKDEQISFDYCMVLSKATGVKKAYKFSCHCCSPECRKVVTWNDWKNPLLQEKYKGYFQYYLEDKIKKLKIPKSSQGH